MSRVNTVCCLAGTLILGFLGCLWILHSLSGPQCVSLLFALPLFGMAITVKPIDAIAKKYVTRAGAAASDYQSGVQAPRQDWATATESASTTYAAGVQAAIGRNAFSRGVAAAGTAKWQRKALAVGPTRYTQGVQAAQGDYASKFAPFRDVLSNLNLPPRAPKGDPANINRVAAIAQALHSKKING